ncbi:MAG: hypothetical protein C0475_02395 [Planctomyces sp.]|nr:hypothetical protein [Planctomyces sp.]MBA4040034.1 hypothetical protein [Planctomyces sp.]MBA4119924.1 hypothetical protein [Isosphaera sp.]
MFIKLCVLILGGGGCAAGLLSLRQQRLDAVHEMIVLQDKMTALDRDLLTLRTRIASLVTPERVERMALALGPLRPLGVSLGERDLAAEPVERREGQTPRERAAAPRARAARGVNGEGASGERPPAGAGTRGVVGAGGAEAVASGTQRDEGLAR